MIPSRTRKHFVRPLCKSSLYRSLQQLISLLTDELDPKAGKLTEYSLTVQLRLPECHDNVQKDLPSLSRL